MIAVTGVSKRFGRVEALDDLNLRLKSGEVLCVLGPNGAGKTTLFRALLGLTPPDTGTIMLFPEALEPGHRLCRARCGFAPEFPAVEPGRSGLDNVQGYARLMGVPAAQAHRSTMRCLQRVGLGDAIDRAAGTYSKGMRQRLNLARAMVHEPQVLLLDEPCSGLDPAGREDVRSLIRWVQAQGTTVLFTSHDVQDAARAASRVAVLHGGRLHWTGAPGDGQALVQRFREVTQRAADARVFVATGS